MARKLALCPLAVSIMALMSNSSQALEINTGDPDLKLRWDNTIKYSNSTRLKGASNQLTEKVNHDDGDRNFSRGLISNRFDVLSEADLTYKNVGVRVSGATWYDSVYNRRNDNNSPATANSLSVDNDEFTSDTRQLHGRDAELLDAFVFARFNVGDSKATVRAGRHALVWGESLFFGANGIAGGMAPIDAVKAASVPNTQFKELIRPTEQLSGQWQLTPDVSVGAFYQLRWEETRLPAAGSYFSVLDTIGDGAERLIAGANPVVPGGPPLAFFRQQDMKAKDSGQGGVQIRFRAAETDFGLYAIRYHDKTPQIYIRPSAGAPDFASGQLGNYQWVYPENIRAFGASASHTFGDYNLAAEVSTRRNTPLISNGVNILDGSGDNDGDARYAVGNSLHAQISWLASLGPSFIANEADFLGEIAWNRLLSVTKNPEALDPLADRDAANIRVSYEPRYRQVFPGIDLSVPLGLGFGIGNSSVVGAFNGDKVGDMSIGLTALYLNEWRASATYTHYFGPSGTSLDDQNQISFKQSLKDRDFIALSLQRSF
ncbi:hypothetical protein ALQ04_03402 [Pseudomonas cichorii]|uniref:DUF1302 domain-containing protein n=1 Tax=Pseudomonas cichorii TaxID=36746 RepID=A0A3M4M722_PSECI|nr:DUF1302 domain-containing protein [Pseudomonas cichorii]RMQ49510.1 hypothetical protein ALQ04_03402 [Pseudomonas cichorii]